MPPKPRDPTAAVASSTARAPTTGSSGAAPGAAPRARTPAGGEDTHSLEVANVRLRRDLDACREQLAAAVFCPIPGGPPEHASASSAWISAQLEQSRRQVLVLSEMLATRADVTIELEAVLLQLRQPAADGTRSDAAVWAGNALKRLHGVKWVEAIAQDIVDGMAALPSGGSHRCSAGNRAPGESRDARVAAVGAERQAGQQVSRPTAAQRSLVAGAPRSAVRHAAAAGGAAVGTGRAGAGHG